MPTLRESEEFKRGRAGEKIIAGYLKSRGCFIVPSYDYSGENGDKAPKMSGLNCQFVIPDLDVARQGKRFWAEVKTKWQATLHRKTARWEHGISQRHFEHYKKVEEITGSPVWLFVLEEQSGIILGQTLCALGQPRIYAGGKMGRDGMAFWPRDLFRVLREAKSDLLAQATP